MSRIDLDHIYMGVIFRVHHNKLTIKNLVLSAQGFSPFILFPQQLLTVRLPADY